MARLPNGRETILCLHQSHFPEDAGGGPVFVTVHWDETVNNRRAFLSPGRYPAFHGHIAWFRLIQHKKGVYTFLERGAGRGGEPFIGPW